MKKLLVVLSMVVILTLSSTMLVSAQTPADTAALPGRGIMGMGLGAGSCLSPFGNVTSLYHEIMEEALAETFGVSEQDIEALYGTPRSIWDLAQDQGYTLGEAWEMYKQAQQDAIDRALEEGLISEDVAEALRDAQRPLGLLRDFGMFRFFQNQDDGTTAPFFGGRRWRR